MYVFLLGQKIQLAGHFNEPVMLEVLRPSSSSYECRVRLTEGSLKDSVLSQEEVQALLGPPLPNAYQSTMVDTEKLRLLVEFARIRMAYSYDRHFAVSFSGIRTLPHQIKALYQRMLVSLAEVLKSIDQRVCQIQETSENLRYSRTPLTSFHAS